LEAGQLIGLVASTVSSLPRVLHLSAVLSNLQLKSSDWILVARVVTGLGTGALTAITPAYIAEVSSAGHRDDFPGYVFIANYLGISVASWLDFGLSFVDNGDSAVRWRFLLTFQCFPAGCYQILA
jgi:MFS family permease